MHLHCRKNQVPTQKGKHSKTSTQKRATLQKYLLLQKSWRLTLKFSNTHLLLWVFHQEHKNTHHKPHRHNFIVHFSHMLVTNTELNTLQEQRTHARQKHASFARCCAQAHGTYATSMFFIHRANPRLQGNSCGRLELRT